MAFAGQITFIRIYSNGISTNNKRIASRHTMEYTPWTYFIVVQIVSEAVVDRGRINELRESAISSFKILLETLIKS